MAAKMKRGAISFTVDGVEREARIGTNAMCAYQEKTGEQFIAALGEISKTPGDMVRLRNLFWAAVVGDLTVEEAGDMIEELGFGEAVDLISKAVEAAFPASDGATGNPKGAKAKAPATT